MGSVPRAIGVIMDGNRRWAKAKGLPTLEGHRAGAEKIFELVSWAHEAGIEEVTVYAFSTENWQRAEEEVRYLMDLAEELFRRKLSRLEDVGARVRFIGDRSRVSEGLLEAMDAAEKRTAGGTKGTLVFALSYGGRPEILAAVNRLLSEGKAEIDEQGFTEVLWSAGLLEPDLILRTGGEQRLSNFLTWQSAYSELFFVDTLWPDLTKDEFDTVLAGYAKRERRHGK